MGRPGAKTCRAIGAVIGLALAVPGAAAADLPAHDQLEHASARFLAAQPAAQTRSGPGGGIAPGAPPLPESRVLALYGAPQMGQTILGIKSPRGAARKLAGQLAPYAELGDRPVAGAFDLVSVFATAGGGPDGLYRSRQDDQIIQIYLDQARAADARLMLDIQPGRSTFLDEIRALREWVAEPDVDVALDPEWNVGRRGIPGQTAGKVSARQIKRVQKKLAAIVSEHDLPPKLLVVHQFREGSIRGRSRIRQRDGVQTILNFDGIGAPAPKEAGYVDLSAPRLFDGFSVFYRLDSPRMSPASVLALVPEPDFLLYQ